MYTIVWSSLIAHHLLLTKQSYIIHVSEKRNSCQGHHQQKKLSNWYKEFFFFCRPFPFSHFSCNLGKSCDYCRFLSPKFSTRVTTLFLQSAIGTFYEVISLTYYVVCIFFSYASICQGYYMLQFECMKIAHNVFNVINL